MKGLMVMNEATDIAFYSVDSQLRAHLHRRMEILENSIGQREEEEDLRGLLTTFFAPLTTSFNVLTSMKKPLFSITADDNFLIVFKKFGEHVFVAVNGDGSESEDFLVRKLHVFNRIIGLLYGPVLGRMNSPNLQQRAMEWKMLDSLLKSYEILYSEEQAFLMEAVEHIVFGQLNAAQDVCISLAEDCLNSSLNGGIPNMKHVLLLVGSKVLAICGRSPQLPTADLLLLILMTTNLYQHDPFLQVTAEKEEENHQQQTPEERGTPYQTPTTSPNIEQPPTAASLPTGAIPIPEGGEGGKRNRVGRDDFPPYKTPDDDIPSIHSLAAHPSKGFGGKLKQAFLGGKKGHLDDGLDPAVFEAAEFQRCMEKFYEKKVFLQLNQSHYTPHMIHCMEIFPQIVIVLISESPSSGLAATICQGLSHLKNILAIINGIKNSSTSSKSMYDTLEDTMKKIIEGSKSESKALGSEQLKQFTMRIVKTWAQCKELQIQQSIDRQQKEEREITKVCNVLEKLVDQLINLFQELYFTPRVAEYDKKAVVSRLMRLSSKLKLDYGDYLGLKARINLPFPGLGMEYPGMVHFAFVDRSFDELTSPTIIDDSVTAYVIDRAAEKEQSPGDFLRSKMWMMVRKAQSYVSNGYSSQTWLDNDFLYTYCMWFSTPNPNLGVPLKMLTPINIKAHPDEPPGVLCGSFYRNIKGGTDGTTPGYINEIYCIHEPRITLDEATRQCRELAISLWMDTKQSLAPFPLIN